MRCENCRFWGERLAYAEGGGPVMAYCLVRAVGGNGPLAGKYTAGFQGCEAGKSNQYGAIDTPHEEDEIARLYAESDAACVTTDKENADGAK